MFVWNVVPVFCIATTPGTGGSASGSPAALDVVEKILRIS